MLPVERKRKILEYLISNQSASISELSALCSVHESTIRRDLVELELEEKLKRTHGGAILEDWVSVEPSFDERQGHNIDEKSRIGQKAAQFIEAGDTVILDSGTTSLQIAKHMKHLKNVQVFTNDINIATELKDCSGIKVYITGGELYLHSYMLNGHYTNSFLESVQVKKAFLGTPAIHPIHGLTHMEAILVPTKQKIIQAAKEVFVVADSSKIGRYSAHLISKIDEKFSLITGKEVKNEYIEAFQEAAIKLYTV
ncbi:DeoR faimly transcriptional regulator [Ureibacillus massiliensis 4400831 = CIP 108448 = CCUG 49529]|uniref:DeoR faimly transcriptional regulator n=1 Tax=Ureibacillus massiliensis 4400831 = CIP 108448 = CCUG 49529 TaxID=1211035 RepID=A0A0A3J759_9BACL|nr:DeoR/GlpR family DNA-binding transcription regulator [Ureibacillus massiliensis]KGR91585.1 DeoR faimly transcriptional regulator [Ureibacillus massiliensis 4400831 = CIP 108448 = CCUG 49529]